MSKVWRYGDHVDTDVIIPARYLNIADFDELAEHAMEDIDTTFASNVQPGDSESSETSSSGSESSDSDNETASSEDKSSSQEGAITDDDINKLNS